MNPDETKVRDALNELDHGNDDHWINSGLPSTDAVEELSGVKVSRSYLNEHFPDVKRKEPAQTDEPEYKNMEGETITAQDEVVSVSEPDVSEDVGLEEGTVMSAAVGEPVKEEVVVERESGETMDFTVDGEDTEDAQGKLDELEKFINDDPAFKKLSLQKRGLMYRQREKLLKLTQE